MVAQRHTILGQLLAMQTRPFHGLVMGAVSPRHVLSVSILLSCMTTPSSAPHLIRPGTPALLNCKVSLRNLELEQIQNPLSNLSSPMRKPMGMRKKELLGPSRQFQVVTRATVSCPTATLHPAPKRVGGPFLRRTPIQTLHTYAQ